MSVPVYFPAANIAQSSTKLTLSSSMDGSEKVVLTGSGFTYDSRGVLLTGKITGIQSFIANKLDFTVSVPNYDAALLSKNILKKADALIAQIETWNIQADLNPEPSVTKSQVFYSLSDGSAIVFLGTFDPNNPNAGTVTDIQHLSSSGDILHEAKGLPLPTGTALMALVPFDTIFLALTGGANTVRAAANADIHFLDGGAGDDILIGSATSLSDYADYSGANAAVRVNLATGQSAGGAGTDKLYSIENIQGSRFSDTLTGNGLKNNLDGGAGHDKIYGFGGDDFLYGWDGNDLLDGGAGKDNISGGNGNDTIIGGSGDDYINADNGNDMVRGGLGQDILYGGAGYDTFVLDTAPSVGNVDSFYDFNAQYDTIALDHNVFTGLRAIGTLSADAFWTNDTGAAHDESDRIILKNFFGLLTIWYDPDGTGAVAAVQIVNFGVLAEGTITNADFKII